MLSRRSLALIAALSVGLFLLTLLPFHHQVSSFAKDQATALKQSLPQVWNQPSFFDEDEPRAHDDVPAAVPSRGAPSPPQVPQEEHDPVAVDWRAHLEQEHSGIAHFGQHAPRLGFSHIYVFTSALNPARKARMELLGKALGAELTFIERTNPKDAKVLWIGERVQEVRAQKAAIIAEFSNSTADRIGGLRTGSPWLHPKVKWHRYPLPYFVKSSAWHWKTVLPKPRYFTVHFPTLEDDRFDGFDWVQFLHYPDSTLDPDDPNFDPADDLHDPLETDDRFQLSFESLAEWYDHHALFLLMDRNADESALVLNDDVDVEWNFERLWSKIERILPTKATANFTDWHLVNLGYESDLEMTRTFASRPARETYAPADPHYIHPLLHGATEALNLTAFAISRAGYKSLLTNLADPWLAFQTRLDVALATLSRTFYTAERAYTTALNAFSIHPPLFTRLDAPLADWTGATEGQREVENRALLADSTMERLWTQAGLVVKERELSQVLPDPSKVRLAVPKPVKGHAGQ
jgi:hypothetical protein